MRALSLCNGIEEAFTVTAEGGLVLLDGEGAALSITVEAARKLAGRLTAAASAAEKQSSSKPHDRLLTADEAAARLDMSERTLRRIRQRGDIAYIALTDRKFRYTPEDCDAYLAARRRLDAPPMKPARAAGRTVVKRSMHGDFMEGREARRAEMRAARKQ
jgi:hypothetical protein